jgi:hypothetical protein
VSFPLAIGSFWRGTGRRIYDLLPSAAMDNAKDVLICLFKALDDSIYELPPL